MEWKQLKKYRKQKMKIKYFSPSYRRGNVRSNTQLNYPFVKLVVAESEAKQYRESGNEVVTMPDPVQGNISRVRNWMLDNLMKRCDCLVRRCCVLEIGVRFCRM